MTQKLKKGDKAPNFSGKDQHGESISLSEILKHGPAVVYFYPKNFTSVCTKEACLFRDAYEELAAKNTNIIGISVDSEASHQNFASKLNLPFHLLSDKSRTITKDYGVGRLFGLLTQRVTFVIDTDQIIAEVFKAEFSAEKHVNAVRATLETLEQ